MFNGLSSAFGAAGLYLPNISFYTGPLTRFKSENFRDLEGLSPPLGLSPRTVFINQDSNCIGLEPTTFSLRMKCSTN